MKTITRVKTTCEHERYGKRFLRYPASSSRRMVVVFTGAVRNLTRKTPFEHCAHCGYMDAARVPCASRYLDEDAAQVARGVKRIFSMGKSNGSR